MLREDPTDVVGIARREAVERELATQRVDRDAEAFKKVIATREGRIFFRWILEKTGVFRSSYTGDQGTNFNEGQRNVGLALMGQLTEHAPEHLPDVLLNKEESDE